MSPLEKSLRAFFGYAVVAMLAIGAASSSAETTLEKIKRTGVMTYASI